MSSSSPSAQRTLRNVLGGFATGVTVLTATVGSETRGMTANGFMSVSLTPPLVLVSIRNESSMLRHIREAGHFGVSVLSESQESLSRHFAGQPVPGLEVEFDEHQGVQLVRGSAARLATRVHETHLAGDHTLVIGEVVHHDELTRDPLIFHKGTYHHSLVSFAEWAKNWSTATAWW